MKKLSGRFLDMMKLSDDDDFEDIEKTIDAVKETTEIMKSLIDIL